MSEPAAQRVTRVLAERLIDHLSGRHETLDDVELETVEWMRRALKRVAQTARRARRDAEGIDPAVTAREVEERAQRISEAFAHLDWRGSWNGRFMGQRYLDEAMVVVYSDDLDQLVELVQAIEASTPPTSAADLRSAA